MTAEPCAPTFLPLIAKVRFPNALRELRGDDGRRHRLDLDWTIARISRPVDRPGTGTLRVGFLGRDKVFSTMTRTDIAAFLIAQLTDDSFRPCRTCHQQLTLTRERTRAHSDRPQAPTAA